MRKSRALKAPHKSNPAKMIKIADKISNLLSILHSPPTDCEESNVHHFIAYSWSEA